MTSNLTAQQTDERDYYFLIEDVAEYADWKSFGNLEATIDFYFSRSHDERGRVLEIINVCSEQQVHMDVVTTLMGIHKNLTMDEAESIMLLFRDVRTFTARNSSDGAS